MAKFLCKANRGAPPARLWVSDALTQGSQITLRYVGMAFGYALVTAWLLIGVALFQRREVG